MLAQAVMGRSDALYKSVPFAMAEASRKRTEIEEALASERND
jgi:hypothetical protein